MSTIRVRRIDAEGEPAWGRGVSDYLTDIDAVAQIIKTRLLLFVNEWWEDVFDGLPLWQEILGQIGTKKEIVDRVLQERIMTTPYVQGIESLTSTLIDREYECEIVVNTTFGQLIIVSNSQ
jgi:hypothetical protein